MIEVFGEQINIMKIIAPFIYILVGYLIYRFIKRIIKKIKPHNERFKTVQKQRLDTLNSMLLNIVKYIIVILVILAILSNFGVNVKSIVTGLGIGTAILGLAFQDFVKDIISGFTIISEGYYEVGDVIEVDDFTGEVLSIGLKTTRLRNFKGATKIIANHYMDNIINYSEDNSLAIVDVGISYDNNELEIEKAFNNLFERLNGNIPDAVKDLELWGVNALSDSSVVYRIAVETKPLRNFAVERFLRKEIKKEFDKSKIKIPYQQIEVHNGK